MSRVFQVSGHAIYSCSSQLFLGSTSQCRECVWGKTTHLMTARSIESHRERTRDIIDPTKSCPLANIDCVLDRVSNLSICIREFLYQVISIIKYFMSQNPILNKKGGQADQQYLSLCASMLPHNMTRCFDFCCHDFSIIIDCT